MRLNSQFGLENIEAFKFLKSYFTQLQSNPLHMGIALAAFFLIVYGLVKINSISREHEHKSDKPIEETGRRYDEDDSKKLHRHAPELDDKGNGATPVISPLTEKALDDESAVVVEDSTSEEGEYSAPEKVDDLINQLKSLQTRFEDYYQPPQPMGSPAPIEKKGGPDFAPESSTESGRHTSTPEGASPDSKKYMDLLESFIFMKDQKNTNNPSRNPERLTNKTSDKHN